MLEYIGTLKNMGWISAFIAVVWYATTYGIYQRDYVQDLEKQVSSLTKDNQILLNNQQQLTETNIKNQSTITELVTQRDQQQQQITELGQQLNRNQGKVESYVKMFQEHNLGYLVYRKPGLMENLINRGTQQAMEDIQDATSAPKMQQ